MSLILNRLKTVKLKCKNDSEGVTPNPPARALPPTDHKRVVSNIVCGLFKLLWAAYYGGGEALLEPRGETEAVKEDRRTGARARG